MTQQQSAPFPLLALPDPCLLAVLQCCAANHQRSLLSAARAHSRLHHAAVAVLRSITAYTPQQRQADCVLLYLDRHSSHVNSLKLWGRQKEQLTLRQLPPSLQLRSLELEAWKLQLQPGSGFQGVLGAAAAAGAPPLKQLRLDHCRLLDGVEALAAALLQLPALEHLSLCNIFEGVSDYPVCLELGVLQQLPHLTHLDLDRVDLQDPDEPGQVLQPLQALTRLAFMRLLELGGPVHQCITASMLSGMQDLTYLVINDTDFQPGALAGRTKLQHLALDYCRVGGAAGVAALLAQLPPLQQLTFLDLESSLVADAPDLQQQGPSAGGGADGGNFAEGAERLCPPAAAYAALTACSKLQGLNISGAVLPAGVWQHLFPADRQLPQLQHLNISFVEQSSGEMYFAPEAKLLTSCCSGLQHLGMIGLQWAEEQLRELKAGIECIWV